MKTTQLNAETLITLATLIAAGKGEPIELEVDPNLPLGPQLEAARAKYDAQHRESCDSCREEYEKEQARAAASEKERAAAMLNRTKATGHVGAAMPEGMASTFGTNTDAVRDRILVGYMAFTKSGKPIPPSFSPEKEHVEAAIKRFNDNQDNVLLQMFAALGVEGIGVGMTVRPVYAD